MKSPSDAAYLYPLAETCLINAALGYRIFHHLTTYAATILQDYVYESSADVRDHEEVSSSGTEHIRNIEAYLRLLKCSYWLPPDRYHYLTPQLLDCLVACLGKDGLDEVALDTLSSLLDLLTKPTVVVLSGSIFSDSQHQSVTALERRVVNVHIIGESLFNHFQELPFSYFSTNAGKAYRVWYQWISHAAKNAIPIEALYAPFYWETLRTGLLVGFSDQRKFCLGIIRQSLRVHHRDIDTQHMKLHVERRSEYALQYERFSILFETIVLDRYPNQVQACLPELTALLGPKSLISPSWATALLAAALNPKVQDGIRKLVGNWYLQYVINQHGPIAAHTSFLIEGFLPWATQGNLFTSSLLSTRQTTSCTHGIALAQLVAKFVTAMQTDPERQDIVSRILGFVVDADGKLFSPAIIYLLEGVLKGLNLRRTTLEADSMDLISRISRLPGLPEVAADLCVIYCSEISNFIHRQVLCSKDLPGCADLDRRVEELKYNGPTLTTQDRAAINLPSLRNFLEQLSLSQHRTIQGEAFTFACDEVISILDNEPVTLMPDEIHQVLDALWEEADRQEYPRRVVIKLPPVLFHPSCIQACIPQCENNQGSENLVAFLSKSLVQLQQFTEGRSYLLPILATSVRRACFKHPSIIGILPIEDFLVRFFNMPPSPKKEFLFEVVAAEKLEQHLQHRDYASYYGQREWHGYAAVVDLLNRFPYEEVSVAQRVIARLLEPWRTQMAPIPIISKWKNVLQLQAMLLLTEICIGESDVDWYLEAFMEALVLEPWPRYRYLLEWIIARIYFRFPEKTHRILSDLSRLDDNSPVHIASLIKLAILAAPFLDSEEFALEVMIQLVPFSASPKVHVRHEAHWSFPSLFSLAKERSWASITANPAFQALDKQVRSLDKFIAPPSTIRTLKLDVVKDYTVTNIFQGRYLRIETPELERVAHDDFLALYAEDERSSTMVNHSARVTLGAPIPDAGVPEPVPEWKNQAKDDARAAASNPTIFQTKSGFDLASLLPSQDPPNSQDARPASVILIASLIDNPTNLGGLSRISESFGLKALYIDDLKKVAHKDFKATSVTSEKHFPIHELKVPAIPEFLSAMKCSGYEIVGIEQTDKSGTLGEEHGGKGIGTLPKKCVLVLGSERGGIASDVLAVLDRCVEIRTVGVTRSLNVQTAGGIALYEWWREWGEIM